MSVLEDVQRVVTLAKKLAPNQCGKSSLFLTAANNALRSAAQLELGMPRYNHGASETAPGEELCEFQGQESGSDLSATLERLLKRPPRGI